MELFEVWPLSCQWPTHCKGRHPAPFARIAAQMTNEARITPTLIAWEWSSCLSPHGTAAGLPAAQATAAAANYHDYQVYLAA